MHVLPLSAAEIEARLKKLPEHVADQSYDANSTHPQSGVAVAQALASLYTHYVGTEIDQTNYTGVNYITPSFKENDLYINNAEKCMYQCISVTPLNDGTGACRYVWQIVSPVVDEVFSSTSNNAQSGKAVSQAVSDAVAGLASKDYVDSALSGTSNFITIEDVKDYISGLTKVSIGTNLKGKTVTISNADNTYAGTDLVVFAAGGYNIEFMSAGSGNNYGYYQSNDGEFYDTAEFSITKTFPDGVDVIVTAYDSVKVAVTLHTEGGITTETDPTVPDWAKASTKPSYTKSEVGLSNVDNTADANKSVKYATSAGSAMNDSDGNSIVDTYAKKSDVSSVFVSDTAPANAPIGTIWIDTSTAPIDTEVLEGDGQEYYTMAPSTLTFRSTALLDEFNEVQINGQTIDPMYYSLEEGSTIVNLDLAYLQTLSLGNYAISVKSTSKVANGNFTVAGPQLNEYGFYYNQPYATRFKRILIFKPDGSVIDKDVNDGYEVCVEYRIEDNHIVFFDDTYGQDCELKILANGIVLKAIDDHLYGIPEFRLDPCFVASDEDFYYVFNSDRHWYEAIVIDNTKESYGVMRTTINGIPVSALAGACFYGCNNLTSLEIPDHIKAIGPGAIDGCDNLTTLTLPESLIELSERQISGINLNYNEYAGGYYLGTKTNPYAYLSHWFGDSHTECIIHKDTKLIGPSAFSNEDTLNYLFENNITSVIIPNNVEYIGTAAFLMCPFTEITISKDSNLQYIAYGAFCSTPITSIVIPPSTTFIDEWSFMNCVNLSSVTVYNRYVSLEGSGLDQLGGELDSPPEFYVYYESTAHLLAQNTDYAINLMDNNGESDHYIISTGYFGDKYNNLIWEFTSAHKLLIKGEGNMCDYESPYDNIFTNVAPWYTFRDQIHSIIIGENVTNIGNYAFYDCSFLHDIVISDSVTSIGNRAFSNCEHLTSVIIGNALTSIGDHAFSMCSKLTSISIPDSVISIGDFTFDSCYNLRSILIGNGVTEINRHVFLNCTSLMNVIIPSSVTSIGYGAFTECRNLTSVTIPENVTSINPGAFINCSSLTEITLPHNLASVGDNIFDNCANLTNIVFTGTTAQWNSIYPAKGLGRNILATYVQCSDGQVAI